MSPLIVPLLSPNLDHPSSHCLEGIGVRLSQIAGRRSATLPVGTAVRCSDIPSLGRTVKKRPLAFLFCASLRTKYASMTQSVLNPATRERRHPRELIQKPITIRRCQTPVITRNFAPEIAAGPLGAHPSPDPVTGYATKPVEFTSACDHICDWVSEQMWLRANPANCTPFRHRPTSSGISAL